MYKHNRANPFHKTFQCPDTPSLAPESHTPTRPWHPPTTKMDSLQVCPHPPTPSPPMEFACAGGRSLTGFIVILIAPFFNVEYSSLQHPTLYAVAAPDYRPESHTFACGKEKEPSHLIPLFIHLPPHTYIPPSSKVPLRSDHDYCKPLPLEGKAVRRLVFSNFKGSWSDGEEGEQEA